MPALSCVEESLSEREEDYTEFEIQLAQGETATEEHGEEHGIDWTDDTWTPTKNTEEVSTSEEDETIEVDSYSDDSDEDYMPTIRIRSGASLAANINVEKLPEISLEDVVHGVVHEPAVQENDDTSIPEGIKVEDPEDIVNQKAAIVYHICLKQLTTFLELPITICTEKVAKKECGAAGPFEVDLIKRGTALIVKWMCPNGHIVWQWNSQPTFKFKMQAGDFMLATNILLSGNNYSKVALLFNYMNMGMVARTTFFSIQDAYCVETIEDFWEESRASVISGLQQDEVVALGDGRMDSPGFSAQYCTYTVMDNHTKKIIQVANTDKRETQGNSTIMEKAAFIQCVDRLRDEITLSEMCTDAHAQISALFSKRWSEHTFDMWHGAKNLGKKIHAAGQQRECKILLQWKKDICNHFWFCCKIADNYDRFFAMWIGLLHHVTGEHEWSLDACRHDPLVDEPNKDWIKKGSKAHKALSEIILSERFLKISTAHLESFHNHLLMYASKRFSFVHPVYKARVFLAALDYNHHIDRPLRRYPDGSVQGRKLFNKKSRCWSFYALKVEKDYAYIPSLQSKIVAARINSKAGLPKRTKLRHNDPRHLGLVCGVPAPSTKELRDKHMSRGDGSMAKLSIVFPWFRIITQCTEVIPQDPGKTQDSCM
ncbi:hypothetical protein WMY93_018100 [Mugilogobius chulae]|uniref:Uncharacterized protein n=1 Tax=Mugilogobius chulae TaxID=88201 RepID=A0AAW0NPR2_9GOBI